MNGFSCVHFMIIVFMFGFYLRLPLMPNGMPLKGIRLRFPDNLSVCSVLLHYNCSNVRINCMYDLNSASHSHTHT